MTSVPSGAGARGAEGARGQLRGRTESRPGPCCGRGRTVARLGRVHVIAHGDVGRNLEVAHLFTAGQRSAAAAALPRAAGTPRPRNPAHMQLAAAAAALAPDAQLPDRLEQQRAPSARRWGGGGGATERSKISFPNMAALR